MFSGPMTLACLLLAAQAGDPKLIPLKDRNLFIPIEIVPERIDQIRTLHLYVSTDEGHNWGLVGTARPGEKGFRYVAPRDGMYWIKLIVIDKSDTRNPPVADLDHTPLSYKILVDSTPPDVRLADLIRTGDTIMVQWGILENYPDEKTFKVEYRTADMPADAPWKLVPDAIPRAKGSVAIKPGTNAAVSVRVSVCDAAGNLGQQIKEVPAVATGTLAGNGQPVPIDNSLAGGPPPPPPPSGSGAGQEQVVTQVSSTNQQGGTTLPPLPQVTTPPAPLPVPQNQVATTRQDQGVENVAQTGGVQTAPGTSPAPSNVPGLPPVTYVNNPAQKLEFEVARVGPSGLGGVDVFQTLDNGQTWTPLRVTPADVVLPVLGEAQKDINPRGSVTVQLTREEIVYGFYLVVKNGALNGRNGPQPGELPQIRMELDTRKPWAQLSRSTRPHPTRRDVITLYWEARDRNLAPKPITLEWSDRKDGGWTFIGEAELPNSPSQIEWQVPQGLPPRVYLRLTVRDLAGNVTIIQNDDPVLIDLSVPEARIVGVSPAGKP
jgi:hypothetical protein